MSEFSPKSREKNKAKASSITTEAINTILLLDISCCKHIAVTRMGDWRSITGIRRTQASSGIH